MTTRVDWQQIAKETRERIRARALEMSTEEAERVLAMMRRANVAIDAKDWGAARAAIRDCAAHVGVEVPTTRA